MKRLIFLVIGFIVLVIAASVIVATSVKDVAVTGVDLSEVTALGFTGVTLKGYVDIYNGGFIPAGVQNITYSVKLEGINGLIGNGVVEGKVIAPKETGRFPISIRIDWVPSIDTALDLLLSDFTYADIEGVVNVASIKVMRVRLPFSARVNLEGYLEQFTAGAPEILAEGYGNDASDIIGSVSGNITHGAGDVVDAIQGMIS